MKKEKKIPINHSAVIPGEQTGSKKKRPIPVQFVIDDAYKQMFEDILSKHNMTGVEIFRQWIYNQHMADFPDKHSKSKSSL